MLSLLLNYSPPSPAEPFGWAEEEHVLREQANKPKAAPAAPQPIRGEHPKVPRHRAGHEQG